MDEKDTNDTLEEIEMGDSEQNKLMAILAYIGPLVIVSFLLAKDEPFVKYHIKQGFVLFVAEVVLWFLMMVFWFLFPIWQILNLVVFVLAIIGIVNVLGGKEKQVPLLGRYAEKFDF